MVKVLSRVDENKKSATAVHEEIEKLLPKLKSGEISVESIMSIISARGKFNESEISQLRSTVNEAVSRVKAEEEVKAEVKEIEKKKVEIAKQEKKEAAKAAPACSLPSVSPVVPLIGVPATTAPLIMASRGPEQLLCQADVKNIQQSEHYDEAVRQLEIALAYDRDMEVVSPRKAGQAQSSVLEQILS